MVSQREEFNSRAFDLTDNELSDVEDYLRNDTASEYLGSEVESNDETSDGDGPKMKRYRRERIPIAEDNARIESTVDEEDEDGPIQIIIRLLSERTYAWTSEDQ